MKVQSELTGKWYDDSNVVYFRNLYQSAYYIKNFCYPLDMFVDGNDKLVMVFDRDKHNELIKLWVANKDICNEK